MTNAQRTSDLVAYLVLVFALSETPTINLESRLRIQLGLLRVGRTFDIDQKRLPKAGLEGLVRELMGTMYKLAAAQAGIDAPQASHRALPNWINFVARFRAADVKFRTRFTGGAKEVFDTGAGMSQAVAGNWVWWPGGHGKDGNQGHVAASVIAENGKIGIISEPLDQPTFVIPSYVVAIP